MSLWEDYEHQYAVLTAEITAKVGQLSLTSGGEFCGFLLNNQ